MTSPQAVWGMVNQLQLLLLLPMLGAYLPSDVYKFNEGIDFTVLSAGFLPISTLPTTGWAKDALDFPQPEDYLSDIGMKSGSAFINQLQLPYMIIVSFLMH